MSGTHQTPGAGPPGPRGRRPPFRELEVLEPLGLRHAWTVYGPDDNLGSINLLTPERVLAASRLVRRGTVLSLVAPLDAIDPPFYGREQLKHTIFELDRNSLDDRLDDFYLQGSSQWDGLRHVRAREFGFWGGHRDAEEFQPSAGPLGIEHWVEHGLVGRGVLLDVARHVERTHGSYDPGVELSIPAELLVEVAEQQGVQLQAGDILCIRFGWMDRYLGLDKPGRMRMCESQHFAGLAADEAMSAWLWDSQVAALACDNPAVEVSPGDRKVGSLHRRLVPLLGLALGELFDFGALARACARDDTWDFLFVSVPLNLPGGVGSPANAVAVR